MTTATHQKPGVLRVGEVLVQVYIFLTVVGVLFVTAGTLLTESAITVQLPVQSFTPSPYPGIEITDPPPAGIRGGRLRCRGAPRTLTHRGCRGRSTE